MATAIYSFPMQGAQPADTVTFPEPSTTTEIFSLKCDDTADEGFQFVIPQLDTLTGSMTIDIDVYADTATSGNMIFDAAALAYSVGDDATSIETAAFATAILSSATAASGTAHVPVRATITLTTGTQQDSAVSGDYFILRVRRLGANGSDTMSGDAQIIGVTLSYSAS